MSSRHWRNNRSCDEDIEPLMRLYVFVSADERLETLQWKRIGFVK